MSKHRTKAQKLKIAARRQDRSVDQPSFSPKTAQPPAGLSSLTWSEKTTLSKPTPIQAIPPKPSFDWRFNPSLIYQDLFKTGLASVLVVGILLLIYYLSFSG